MTKGMDSQMVRKQRIGTIRATLAASKESFEFINYEYFLAELQASLGCTERKAKEYLGLAITLEKAKINADGEIVWN